MPCGLPEGTEWELEGLSKPIVAWSTDFSGTCNSLF